MSSVVRPLQSLEEKCPEVKYLVVCRYNSNSSSSNSSSELYCSLQATLM
jgi:hypothetical protein